MFNSSTWLSKQLIQVEKDKTFKISRNRIDTPLFCWNVH